jgi:hypothetical protein
MIHLKAMLALPVIAAMLAVAGQAQSGLVKHNEQQAVRFKLDVRPHGEARIRCQGRGEAPDQPGENEGQTVNQNLFAAGLDRHCSPGADIANSVFVSQGDLPEQELAAVSLNLSSRLKTIGNERSVTFPIR